MKKPLNIFFLVTSLLTFVSCNFSVKGEGSIKEKEIKINLSSDIKAKGNFRLVCLQDDKEPRIIIETYENLIENVRIDNTKNQLSISETRKVENTDLYNIYVYNSSFENFELYDKVTAEVNTPLRVNKLNISLFENCKFLENNLIAEEVIVKAKDKSKINLQGNGTKIDVRASGSANLSAVFYTVKNAHIILSNAATAEINSKEKVTGEISDNSQLTLIGNPVKDIKLKELAKIKNK